MSKQRTTGKWDFDIVFIGGSITSGARFRDPNKEAPQVIAKEYLLQQPGVGKVEIINQGKSGYTMVDFLPSYGNTFSKVIAATNQLHKDYQRLLVFSISLGTNDSAIEGTNGSPVSANAYYKNLQVIADQLLSNFPDCKIIIQQPIWFSPNTYNSAKYLAEGLARVQIYFPELNSLIAYYFRSNPGL